MPPHSYLDIVARGASQLAGWLIWIAKTDLHEAKTRLGWGHEAERPLPEDRCMQNADGLSRLLLLPLFVSGLISQ